jgi:serine/threonine protein kinase
VGGTAIYASPEQRAAFAAVTGGRAIDSAVGVTSDIYSLGVVLAECLGATLPVTAEGIAQLVRRNPQVSQGLADILARCVAVQPERRYPTAAAVAEDLRLHLQHRPLQGVRNRSLAERWRKWRRRAPHTLHLLLLALAVVTGLLVTGVHFSRDLAKAEAALVESETLLRSRHYEEAAGAAERGLELISDQPWHSGLRHSLEAVQQEAKGRLVGPE